MYIHGVIQNRNDGIECNAKAENLRSEISDKDTRKRAINTFLSELKNLEPIYTEFDEKVFRGLCEKITVYSKDKIVVTFKSGYDVESFEQRPEF